MKIRKIRLWPVASKVQQTETTVPLGTEKEPTKAIPKASRPPLEIGRVTGKNLNVTQIRNVLGKGKGLQFFFQAIDRMKISEDTVRIAYFGDSMIEGDLITQDLRKELQTVFGGHGVGFVPITSPAAAYRKSISHSYSNSWQTYSLLTGTRSDIPRGISGCVYVPQMVKNASENINKRDSWINIRRGDNGEGEDFSLAKVFFINSDSHSCISFRFDDGLEKSIDLTVMDALQQVTLYSEKPARQLRVNFKGSEPVFVYGLSIESENGIFVDNLSLRGHSGTRLISIPSSLLSSFNNYLQYKLIILHYGVNVADPHATGYQWYEEKMVATVQHLQKSFPEASILLVSVGDQSIKEGEDYVTSPCISKLLKSQERIAERTGIAFWNLFEAMGGEDSMVRWVNRGWAAKDYTHFSGSGAKKVAQSLTKTLLSEYSRYGNSAD
ncbi:MAG: hypothetical protein WCQ90_05770 [Deltaproteobacteria bacterium]